VVTRQSFGTFAKPANGWARTVFVAMLTRRADLARIEVLEVWQGYATPSKTSPSMHPAPRCRQRRSAESWFCDAAKFSVSGVSLAPEQQILDSV
jgi:hypothetical protein